MNKLGELKLEDKMKFEKQYMEDYKVQCNTSSCLIKSVDEFNQLREWIYIEPSKVKFTLLYDSFLDSDLATAFHDKCDNKGATLSIIESEHGLRFGGYTTLSWEKHPSGLWKSNDPYAFIFSLSKMKNFRCINQSNVILCYKDNNVVFGYDGDIYIYDNFTYYKSWSNFGDSYDSSGVEDDKRCYLAGSNNFNVKKMEVYKVDILDCI
jgi:hypothetical protein